MDTNLESMRGGQTDRGTKSGKTRTTTSKAARNGLFNGIPKGESV